MTTYQLTTGRSLDALEAFDSESLDDLELALRERLAQQDGSRPVDIGFHPGPAPAFTVPDAFELLVTEGERLPASTLQIRCLFATERAAAHCARFLPETDRPKQELSIGPIRVRILIGDIVRIRADAIVNASNTQLVLGAGVSGAIRRAVSDPAGLQAAMTAKAPIAAGGAVVTGSFGLPKASAIVHAATATGGAEAVRRALRNVLDLCVSEGIDSVAIPALGCGTGGLDVEAFARIAREEIARHAAAERCAPSDLFIVFFDAASHATFVASFGDRG